MNPEKTIPMALPVDEEPLVPDSQQPEPPLKDPPVDAIFSDDNSRSFRDPGEQAELTANLAEHGLINPITVEQVSENSFRIVCGEGRWLAAKTLGWETIKAFVYDKPLNVVDRLWINLSENATRSDLCSLDKGISYKALMEAEGLSLNHFSKKSGISRRQVSRDIQTAEKLPTAAYPLIRSRKLSGALAELIITKVPEEQRLRLCELTVEKAWTKAQLQDVIRKLNQKGQGGAEWVTIPLRYDGVEITSKILDGKEAVAKLVAALKEFSKDVNLIGAMVNPSLAMLQTFLQRKKAQAEAEQKAHAASEALKEFAKAPA